MTYTSPLAATELLEQIKLALEKGGNHPNIKVMLSTSVDSVEFAVPRTQEYPVIYIPIKPY
jgi:hypothetical protein